LKGLRDAMKGMRLQHCLIVSWRGIIGLRSLKIREKEKREI